MAACVMSGEAGTGEAVEMLGVSDPACAPES